MLVGFCILTITVLILGHLSYLTPVNCEYIIKGKRVGLRKFLADDEAAFILLNQESRDSHFPWVDPPKNHEDFQAFLNRDQDDSFECFAACLLECGDIIGALNLSQIFRGSFQSAYLGFYAGSVYTGKGLMTEALSLLLHHLFDPKGLNLHRVEANIQPQNHRSLNLVKRCGFNKEGYSPNYLKIQGKWCDHERWAMHYEGWKKR